jgi:glutamine amidotransferase
MITIVDYNAGNLRSVQRACAAVGAESVITADPDAVANATRLIFPGVGAAHSAMATLRSTGLDEALRTAYRRGIPFLGLCLGTQIILQHSEEGDVPCLGLLEGQVVKFQIQNPLLKVPHMGWNAVRITRSHPVLDGIASGIEFYFVHSYHPASVPDNLVCGVTEYEYEFPCVLARENLFATQFHPEKSGRYGLKLIENFTQWNP